MVGLTRRRAIAVSAMPFVVAVALVIFETPARTQNTNMGGHDDGLTYARGQSVVPIFGGWMANEDGTFDMYFSYFNRNWAEEVDIPIGPDNNIQPLGPDAGQPTHFLPRNNRWIFTVRVPKDWGQKDLVWTLTSHGQTSRTFGTLKPGYIIDDYSLQHEFGGDSTHGRKDPVLKVEGDKRRTVKAGQAVPLVAVATDENPTRRARVIDAENTAQAEDEAAPRRGAGPRSPQNVGPGAVGGDSVRSESVGLRFSWFVYRGATGTVKFDPPMAFKVWEDQRGGSPWSPGWQPPPIPPGNKWTYNAIFKEPGTYVLRALAHNGSRFKYEDVTFTVTQ